jgi:hypothetical protein
MIPKGYVRVSRSRKCPVCGKPDFCLLSVCGQFAGCSRTQAGCDRDEHGREVMVALTVPTWRHTVNADLTGKVASHGLRPTQQREVHINAGAIHRASVAAITDEQVSELGAELGLSTEALAAFGVGWNREYSAYSFPMYDSANARIVGIRLRKPDGSKLAVRGSRHGCFLPHGVIPTGDSLAIVEGPTDAAAIFDWGFDNVIGLPSCHVLADWVLRFVRTKEVVIFGNFDDPKERPDGSTFCPGQESAERLAAAIADTGRPVKVVYPSGHKDWRAWKNSGAKRARVLATVRNTMYRKVGA